VPEEVDVQDIKRRFWFKELKRGKRQEVVVNANIQDALEEYFAAYPETIGDQNNYIFFNIKAYHFKEPIKRGQAWKTITTICRIEIITSLMVVKLAAFSQYRYLQPRSWKTPHC
jgi:hypothetical protein